MSDVQSAPKSARAAGPEGHPLFRSKNRLKLGAFAFNLWGGHCPTLAEGRIEALNWAQQLRIAQKCEAVGLDAIVPISRWKTIGGASNFWHESYETIPWAAALAASTANLTIFSTVHVPLLHPVRAAKTAATIDHVSGGRFGLNIVAGWLQSEFAQFGHHQLPHDERYAQAEEWTDLVKKLWSEEKAFDWNGKYYQGTGCESFPRPVGTRPLLMSAGSSPAGQAFAAKNCDLIYIVAPPDLKTARERIQGIKTMAASHGRNVQVWCAAGVMCCPTEAEAQRRYDYMVHEKGDREGAALLVKAIMGGDARSAGPLPPEEMLVGAMSWIFAYPLIGTPGQVVEKMAGLADAGLDGMAFVWVDNEEGLDIFGTEIRPLARKAGLVV